MPCIDMGFELSPKPILAGLGGYDKQPTFAVGRKYLVLKLGCSYFDEFQPKRYDLQKNHLFLNEIHIACKSMSRLC